MGNFFSLSCNLSGGGEVVAGGEVLPRRCRIMIPRPHVSRRVEQQKNSVAACGNLVSFCPCVPKVWTASMLQVLTDPDRFLLGSFIHRSLIHFGLTSRRLSLVVSRANKTWLPPISAPRHSLHTPVSWVATSVGCCCTVSMDSVPSEEASHLPARYF